ncbi:MAG: HDOD domain-containing protein [Desulfatitalea sp.]|nr:HDOD domain-containing protein [Desulfatitalea sp.]
MTIQRHHVSAGTFQTSTRQPKLLQAYLGTCVGVAVHCTATGIGGMLHLLLPEPVSTTTVAYPEKYAATGVPLFLDALLALGAQRETMVATLAGGALVGPLSSQDFTLDIGGRTSEKVREILNSQDIEIQHSETGGFFTCCLNLDMATSQCTIEPVGQNKLTPLTDIKIPSTDEILAAMTRLRPIPQVALKVLRMIDEEGYRIDQVAGEIRKDQVITARTLSLANSALYGKKRPIDSLDHALVYLGEEQLVKLVLLAAVESYFEQSGMGYSLCKGGLYHHALGCAHLAETLAANTGKAEPHKAYTAGLLHDIGKVVLDQYVAAAFPLFYRQAMENHANLLTVERQALGIDHTEVGHLLARQWSLPDYLAGTIKNHHYPDKESVHKPLALIVYLADLLLSRFRIGLEFERLDTRTLANHLASLDLGVEGFAELVDLIPKTVLNPTTAEMAPPPANLTGKDNPHRSHAHQ